MNRPLRVLLVGRRFWPHTSIDAASHLFELACALQRQGLHVEVLTPHYASSWPESFTIRDIKVHRPISAPRSDWSIGRYVRHLTTALKNYSESFDVMLVDAIREEAIAAIDACRSTEPRSTESRSTQSRSTQTRATPSRGRTCRVVIRAGGWGPDSDPHWWTTSRSAGRCCAIGRMADAVIATSAQCQRSLLTHGYDPQRVRRIDPGFAAGPTRSAESRAVARKNLAAANSDLMAEDDAPVVLCGSPMTDDSGIDLLVRSTRHLVSRYPSLRVWLIGEGPRRDSVFEELRSDGVRASIAMPGTFCDVSDMLAAADVFVQPDHHGLDCLLPAAISAEIPVVAVDHESTRTVITGSGRALAIGARDTDGSGLLRWCGAATAKEIRLGVISVLSDLATARENASQLRRQLLRTRPQFDTVTAYVATFEQVIAESSDRPLDRGAKVS